MPDTIKIDSLPEDLQVWLCDTLDNWDIAELPVVTIAVSDLPVLELADPETGDNRGETYAAEMVGEDLPPITVIEADDGWDVLDGRHRLAAHRLQGTVTITAINLTGEDK
jgi:hypothetical protein